MNLKKYIELKYPDALNAIRQSEFAKQITELTDYEKAIIYKYTDDGYVVNDTLRDSKGLKVSQFATHLNTVLAKLPSLLAEETVVYRGVNSSNFVLNQYKTALRENTILTEYGFISASKSPRVANQFGQILLIIFSKNGKSIENLSKFGTNSSSNEQEILFQSGSKFNVLDIEENNNNTIIILQEL
jgi:ADP-ribosyltransferase exoenzyme